MMANALNILLVEDVEIAQKMGVLILKQLNCSLYIDVASTGAEALDLCKQNEYDIIFMDLGLPDINGIELTQQIKTLEKVRCIPVVALTAHGDNEYRQSCKNAGMVGFIEKPLILENCRKIFNKLGLL